MTHTIIRRALVTGALAAVLATSACSSDGSGSGSVTYAPAAYGVSVGSVYECYYVENPAEVTALEAAGLCPAHSRPTLIPTDDLAEYWGYYSSPSYYDEYMPVRYRSTYTSVYVVKFSKTNSRLITSLSSKATYKGSNGTTVKGGTSKLKFSSGSGTGAVHSGGSGRVGACAESMTVLQDKSSGSSTVHSGGSGRSGSTAKSRGNGSNGC